MQAIDATEPTGAWAFDAEVTNVFENMLERSIPQYSVMRDLCFKIGRNFVSPDTHIFDLGCSTGEALAPFVESFGQTNLFTGIDVSDSMLIKAAERYADNESVTIERLDLRRQYPVGAPSLVLGVLVIQFTPIEYRQQILQRIYDSLEVGGAFILVEKVIGATAILDDTFVSEYYALKTENGYTQEQIDRKRVSLEGVLVPVTAEWNEELLHQTGFRKLDCFWRFLNFAGWVAVK